MTADQEELFGPARDLAGDFNRLAILVLVRRGIIDGERIAPVIDAFVSGLGQDRQFDRVDVLRDLMLYDIRVAASDISDTADSKEA